MMHFRLQYLQLEVEWIPLMKTLNIDKLNDQELVDIFGFKDYDKIDFVTKRDFVYFLQRDTVIPVNRSNCKGNYKYAD